MNNSDSQKYSEKFISENIDYELFKTKNNEANIKVISRYLHQVFSEIIPNIQVMKKIEIMHFLEKEADYLRSVLYKEDTHDKNQ
jgi:hypothetical protein